MPHRRRRSSGGGGGYNDHRAEDLHKEDKEVEVEVLNDHKVKELHKEDNKEKNALM
jgi:hypothetical protein